MVAMLKYIVLIGLALEVRGISVQEVSSSNGVRVFSLVPEEHKPQKTLDFENIVLDIGPGKITSPKIDLVINNSWIRRMENSQGLKADISGYLTEGKNIIQLIGQGSGDEVILTLDAKRENGKLGFYWASASEWDRMNNLFSRDIKVDAGKPVTVLGAANVLASRREN